MEDLTRGGQYVLLSDTDVLVAGDETARLSLLQSKTDPEGWNYVETDLVGITVSDYKKNDMDAAERVFRRKGPYVESDVVVRARRVLKRVEREITADWEYHDFPGAALNDIKNLAKCLRELVGPDPVKGSGGHR